MKTFSEKHLLSWVCEQPADRKIDMTHGVITNDKCGCLMGEFLKDQGITSGHVTMYGNVTDDRNDPIAGINLNSRISIFGYYHSNDSVRTIGDLRASLHPRIKMKYGIE